MATRAHLREQITSDKIGALTPVAFATVSVYETGTTTPVAATMYQTASGVGVFTNPLTADANGVVEFWMTNAQVVDLAITAAGYNAATVTAQVIGTDTATGILNLNTTTVPAVAGDVRINGENFTYEGAASLHTAGTLDQAQTYTGLKTFSGGVSADGTHALTLPAATDTLVGKATTDTLTNKTLTTPVITGSGGTLTLPAGPDTLVARATTDTLTNKTLTAATLNGGVTLGTPAYGQTSTGAVSLTALTNSLSGDVALNNTANYFDGPSVAQGTSGTWFVSGTVTVSGTANDGITCKLWDGTTVIASATSALPTTAFNSLSLSGVITSPAGNLRVSVKDNNNTNGKILFNQSGNSKDSTITAVRIA